MDKNNGGIPEFQFLDDFSSDTISISVAGVSIETVDQQVSYRLEDEHPWIGYLQDGYTIGKFGGKLMQIFLRDTIYQADFVRRD